MHAGPVLQYSIALSRTSLLVEDKSVWYLRILCSLTYHGIDANEFPIEDAVFLYNEVLEVLKLTGIECTTLTGLRGADKSKLRGPLCGELGGGGL